MSWDLTALREAVCRSASVLDKALRTYPYMPGQMQPPCLVVTTGEPYVERNLDMGNHLAIIRLRLTVVVPLSNVEASQRLLDRFVVDLPDALAEDPLLGDRVCHSTIGNTEGFQEVEIGGVSSVGFSMELELVVDD